MIFNFKIDWRWPFLRWLNKESSYEILPELTPDEKRFVQELKSAIKADRADASRSARG